MVGGKNCRKIRWGGPLAVAQRIEFKKKKKIVRGSREPAGSSGPGPGRVDRDQWMNRTGTGPLSRKSPIPLLQTGPGPAGRFSDRSRAGAGRPGPPATPSSHIHKVGQKIGIMSNGFTSLNLLPKIISRAHFTWSTGQTGQILGVMTHGPQ